MDRKEYVSNVYVGKHEPHTYEVWRVLSAIGPQETITVTGKQALREAVDDCWDYEVTDLTTGEENVIV